MKVTVEGTIVSVGERRTTDGRVYGELTLVQDGERLPVFVRVPCDTLLRYERFENVTITGRLVIWSGKNGNIVTFIDSRGDA